MAMQREQVLILPLRQQVVFPAIRSHINIESEAFAHLCAHCEKHDTAGIGVVAVKPGSKSGEELYSVGTYTKVIAQQRHVSKVGNVDTDVTTLTLEGQYRFRIVNFTQTAPYRIATIEALDVHLGMEDSPEVQTLHNNLQEAVVEVLKDYATQDRSGTTTHVLRSMLSGNSKQFRFPTSPSVLADMVAAGLGMLSVSERQLILEKVDIPERLEAVTDLVKKVSEVQRLSKEISSKIQKRTEDELREDVLKRQLQELNRELRKLKHRSGGKPGRQGEDGGDEGDEAEEREEEEEDDIVSLRESLRRAQLSEDAQKIAHRELRRLQNIQPHHPEYSVCRTYLETLAGLPWAESSKDDLDLPTARQILEKDHHGLEKVKRRILEFLAVQKMRGDMKGPILCLHGPPGVGKTSLGRSIAKALGRKFHRIALGGVRDEAELRGHRRTYIGSMPGAIIQALSSMQVNNPVILLDEIDKLTKNAMFNPSGALLELLDPEQNHTFKDHYLNTPFDLSRVLFLCTCNDLHMIDRPLLDRMEVIDLSGYTVEEKVHIATTHLLPKQRRLHALEAASAADAEASGAAEPPANSSAGAEAPVPASSAAVQAVPVAAPVEPVLMVTRDAVADLITKWTMESGVRSLERRIAQICRWAALRLAGPRDTTSSGSGSSSSRATLAPAQREAEAVLAECGPDESGRLTVDAQHLPHIVGIEMFEPDLAERLTVGVAMGLGVTSTGGQLLFVEATRNKGSGRLTVTGQLGEVMRESVSTAMSLLRSKLYYAALGAGPADEARSGGSASSAAAAAAIVDRSAGAGGLAVGLGDVAAGALSALSVQARQRAGIAISTSAASASAPTRAAARSAISAVGATDSARSQALPKFQEVFQQLLARPDATKDPFGSDDIHVHFPAGAIPKDGPSAGVATTLALASLLLNRPVRSDTAVTGEITLRGHVLPVGGIRDKVLAAHRAGIRHVLLPFGNQRHVKDDIPASALGDVELHYLKHIDEALAWAFADGTKDSWAATVTTPVSGGVSASHFRHGVPWSRL